MLFLYWVHTYFLSNINNFYPFVADRVSQAYTRKSARSNTRILLFWWFPHHSIVGHFISGTDRVTLKSICLLGVGTLFCTSKPRVLIHSVSKITHKIRLVLVNDLSAVWDTCFLIRSTALRDYQLHTLNRARWS